MKKLSNILKSLRSYTGDNIRVMAKKLDISSSYLSAIENDKRPIPDGFGEKLVKTYNLNDVEAKQIADAIAVDSELIKLKTDELSSEERKIIFAISKGEINKETLTRMCEVIDKKEMKK